MRKIVTIRFGSHLYGTATAASDIDLKSIFVSDGDDILMQRVKDNISTHREKAMGEKNVAGEIDEESISLQRFLQMSAEGQTMAIDMLFAPEWSYIAPPEPEWIEIIANRHRLLTRKSAAFVGYCQKQANKYGIKGSRVAAAREALRQVDGMIDRYDGTKKLGDFSIAIKGLAAAHEHMAVVPIKQSNDEMLDHWEVGGRKLSYKATLRYAHDVLTIIVEEYGQRALMAERQEGVDWKALSHAVRVGHEALELLRTGHVTFPLPTAARVLNIKMGRSSYQGVATEIETLMAEVTQAAAISPLPDQPDYAWIEQFVCRVYRRQINTTDVIVWRAQVFATAAHAAIAQLRKYTGEAYIVHPEAVANLVRSVPHTPAMLAAAWLHDVVEDTEVKPFLILEEFGREVADLVAALTDVPKSVNPSKEYREQLNIERLAAAPPAAQTIKLADMIHNTESIEARDPNFAKVYRHAKRRLLAVMIKGDPALMAIALKQLEEPR